MFTKAKARSSSETSSTWSNRATALRTCAASVIGSLCCLGNANTVSGRLLRVVRFPDSSNGSQVALAGDMFYLHDSSAADAFHFIRHHAPILILQPAQARPNRTSGP